MVKGIQYGGGISSIRWKIFSTDVSHHQYGGGASSVQSFSELCEKLESLITSTFDIGTDSSETALSNHCSSCNNISTCKLLFYFLIIHHLKCAIWPVSFTCQNLM